MSRCSANLTFPGRLGRLCRILRTGNVIICIVSTSPMSIIRITTARPSFNCKLSGRRIVNVCCGGSRGNLVRPDVRPNGGVAGNPNGATIVARRLVPGRGRGRPLVLFKSDANSCSVVVRLGSAGLYILFGHCVGSSARGLTHRTFHAVRSRGPHVILRNHSRGGNDLHPSRGAVLLKARRRMLVRRTWAGRTCTRFFVI